MSEWFSSKFEAGLAASLTEPSRPWLCLDFVEMRGWAGVHLAAGKLNLAAPRFLLSPMPSLALIHWGPRLWGRSFVGGPIMHLKPSNVWVLNNYSFKPLYGEMSEWFKVQPWKGCVRETAPRVQISFSPPDSGIAPMG